MSKGKNVTIVDFSFHLAKKEVHSTARIRTGSYNEALGTVKK